MLKRTTIYDEGSWRALAVRVPFRRDVFGRAMWWVITLPYIYKPMATWV